MLLFYNTLRSVVDSKHKTRYNMGTVIDKEKKMILAEDLTKYVTFDRYELSNILARSGYSGMSFNSVKFLGLTNSGNFCYSVKYFDDHIEGEQAGKVFVSKSAAGEMTAEF
jgi:hypothetical protein